MRLEPGKSVCGGFFQWWLVSLVFLITGQIRDHQGRTWLMGSRRRPEVRGHQFPVQTRFAPEAETSLDFLDNIEPSETSNFLHVMKLVDVECLGKFLEMWENSGKPNQSCSHQRGSAVC